MNLYEILQNPDRVGEGMTHFERLFAQKVGDGKINEISGVPPLRYIGDGRPLTDYLISGNTVQDGTPTPESHVDATGCGTDTEDGFKLPLTVNGAEYPIYLGQVESTRRVKKLVLTGEEAFGYSTLCFTYTFDGKPASVQPIKTVIFSNAYKGVKPMYRDLLRNYECCITRNFNQIAIRDNNYTDVASFKSYLAAQYANGTPVTVWYVLETPETGIVNEPLMKIGDYADTISFAQAGVTIPTVSGANVLDVPTEVPPSEVLIRGRIKEV